MTSIQKKIVGAVLLYFLFGFLFDFALYKRNAPAGIKYSVTPRFVYGWPYYFYRFLKEN